ncbi:hypothetical protein JCM3770_005208 [Rhodotorula araucariae]
MAAETLPAVPNLAVVLLLGGQSSRMGSPKHLLLHPVTQRPLYRHHLEVLKQLKDEGVFPEGVYVSAREDQRGQLEVPEGIEILLDNPERNGDIGPAGGILQAFAAKPTATWLLLAVDLPFITRVSVLHLLTSHTADSPVSLFLHPSDGNPEPLFSVWTPPALEQLRQNCLKGKSGPCRAAKDVWGGKIIEGKGGVKVLGENWVTDADTPEEWEKAVAALAQSELAGEDVVKPLTPPPSPRTLQKAFSPTPRRSIPFRTAIQRIRALPLFTTAQSDVYEAPQVPHPADPPARLPLVQATGGIAAADVHAALPHPLHDNSAMDGYAVPSSLLSSASPAQPVSLPVLGRIVAGDPPPPPSLVSSLGSLGCWEIMTGAVFPSGTFDAVVKVEDVRSTETDEAGRRVVRFEAPIRREQNRRKCGEQVHAGDTILRAGERISPEKVLLLAACGVAEVVVHAALVPPPTRGRVGVVATGKEVVPLSSLPADTGNEPLPGQVVDCITPYLSSLLSSAGFEPVLLSPTGDSTSSFAATVSSALSASPPLSLLITVAGVSLGVTDHLPATLSRLGLTSVFHGVNIRPGGPVMLSHRPPPADVTLAPETPPVLSLPGNPMASAACMRSFGAALLARLGGSPGAAWTAMDVPRQEGEEARAWADVVARVQGGMSSFSAVPVDPQTGMPCLSARIGKRRAGPCALGSLVGASAWVRVDASEDGMTSVEWCSF